MSTSFLNELKRRHVYRVGVAYAAVAFVVLQGADLILPALGVSERAFRFVVVLLLAGFPVALVLSWLFDITPDGVRRTVGSPSEEVQPARAWAVAWSGALLGSAGLLALAGWWAWDSAPSASEDSRMAGARVPADVDPRSLAVLPFANLSGDPDEQYFSDGLTDAIITALTRVRGLRVASRTSAFALQDRGLTVEEVADTLGVASVLTGTVRASDGTVVVDVRLADARDRGFELWTERYERPVGDVFAIQDGIAESIVDIMEVTLAERPDPPLVDAPTTDPMAYDKYLWGVYNRNKGTVVGMEEAAGNFQDAIMLDSAFAEAYAGLAQTWLELAGQQGASTEGLRRDARTMARRALDLDSASAAAHLALASLALEADGRWGEAELLLRRVATLEPNEPSHHRQLAILAGLRGAHDGAVRAASMAARLDPLSEAAGVTHGLVLTIAGQKEEAERVYRRTLATTGGSGPAWALWTLLVSEDRTEEAVELHPVLGLDDRQMRSGDVRGVLEAIQDRADPDLAGAVPVGRALAGDVQGAAQWFSDEAAAGTLDPDALLHALGVPAFARAASVGTLLRDLGLRS